MPPGASIRQIDAATADAVLTLAKTLLQDIWALDRDSIGVSAPETGTTYNQITTPIFIPSGWTGTMPNGDPINSDSTFLSIRPNT
ncbi:MAG: glycoside hydrolase family 48 protein [Terracidiphilus sp.]|jgi:hypothetical protein